MKIIRSISELRRTVCSFKKKGRSIGFVPTMGAFHEGHTSLMRRARRENQAVVVSLFVNPTQFGLGEDFKRYPRRMREDAACARRAGVDVLFTPSVGQMYPRGNRTGVEVGPIGGILCGRFRPGHFQGVATVVAKLLNLVQPDRAYFGEKDFQQLLVIEQLVQDLNFPVQICRCPTVRDRNGLALSSRNAYLSREERKRALSLSRALREVARRIQSGERRASILIRTAKSILKNNVDRLDYFEIRQANDLAPLKVIPKSEWVVATVAARVGRTRLIDNRKIKAR